MAPRRGSIIASAKSIPGAARPTPAPQGIPTAPYQGAVSPLAAQLDSGGTGTWQGAYRGYLPRPSADFTAGAFGPFSPILPVPVDAPAEGSDLPDPRLWQYDVGWNLPVGQPGSEGIKLADFNTLRTLADLYSVARACIQLRKSEIRSIEWDILPTHDAAKAMRGDHKTMRDFGERRAQAVKFFKRPDPDYFSWGSFIDALLEEVLVFDAMSLLVRKKWAKGRGRGILGSDLDSLSLVSGPTIRPLIDLHGAKPRPPAPAYQQYLYGVPRCDLMTLINERDIEDGGLSGAEMNRFRADQLLYLPLVPRRWTPYGFPPIERALVPVMSGLQKQGWQLDYYREGTVPAVYVSPGSANQNMTPNQIRELQDALNAIAGDPAWHHKIIVLPADSKVMPQRQQELADAFDEIVMAQVCMAFDIQPMELGISPKVSTTQSPGAANQMAKSSQDIHQRKATKPLLTYLTDIMNAILQDVCGQDDMRFVFEGLEEKEDEATKTSMLVAQIGAGLASIDEGREELNRQPWGLPETSDPGWATPAGGWVPLADAIQAHRTGYAAGPLFELDPDGKPVPAQTPPPTPGTPPSPAGGKPTPAPKPATGGPTGNAGQSPGHEAAEGAAAADAKGAASKAARTVHPRAARHQARRGQHVDDAVEDVTRRLGQIVAAYQAGTMAAPSAVDTAVAALAAGYRTVMARARADAQHDHGLGKGAVTKQDDGDYGYIGDPELDSNATQRAEGQRSYLMGLLKAVAQAGATGLSNLASRLGLYGRTLNTAYNETYGQTLQAAPATYEIVWRLGHTEHCALCLERDGSVYTFDTLPGYPGDGGFGGAGALCYGGQNCGCSLDYVQAGSTLASGQNSARPESIGYYQQQLADITARRQEADQARRDFLDTIPDAPAARAHTRDSIRRELADLANARIRAGGGYPGISVEPGDIPASEVAAHTPAHMKAAVTAELEALERHLRKGRLISTWEPRHIDGNTVARIAEDIAKGLTAGEAVSVAKARLRVDLNGQPYMEDDVTVPTVAPVSAAGGGGRVFPAHDVEGIELPPLQQDIPGAKLDDAPPRWQPPDQPVMTPVPGPPTAGRVAKGAADLGDPNPVEAAHVAAQLSRNYPEKAIRWVYDARWIGPVLIPVDRIDMDDADSWAASHDKDRVKRFAKEIEDGDGHLHPIVAVQEPGDDKVKVVDGHHRTLAYRKLGQPVKAYIGFVDTDGGAWDETHSYQVHQGDDDANKGVKSVSGYTLSPRSGMISLDLPEGLIPPVPGGVTDHHVTVVYLGPDLDDEAIQEACERARTAAAAIPGPLVGTVAGADSFEPSDSSDGLRPAFAPVTLPGVEVLRMLLEDLSASEHTTYHPHVTLSYLGPDDPMPESVPSTPVRFAHLSVHRKGDPVRTFPFGSG